MATYETVTICFVPVGAEIAIRGQVFPRDAVKAEVWDAYNVKIDGKMSVCYQVSVKTEVVVEQLQLGRLKFPSDSKAQEQVATNQDEIAKLVSLLKLKLKEKEQDVAKVSVYAMVRFRKELSEEYVRWLKERLSDKNHPESKPHREMTVTNLTSLLGTPTVLGAWSEDVSGATLPVYAELLIEPIEDKEKEDAKAATRAARV